MLGLFRSSTDLPKAGSLSLSVAQVPPPPHSAATDGASSSVPIQKLRPPQVYISALGFTPALSVPLLSIFGPRYIPGAPGLSLTFLFTFFVIPVFDAVLPLRETPRDRPPAPRRPFLESTPGHWLILALTLFLSLASFARTLALFARPNPTYSTPSEIAAAVSALSIVAVSASMAAHELVHVIHGPWPKLDQLVGHLFFAAMQMAAYPAGHAQHHRLVGTAEDAITAQKGLNFYSYAVQRERNNFAHALGGISAAFQRARGRGVAAYVRAVVCDRFLGDLLFGFGVSALVRAWYGPLAFTVYMLSCAIGSLSVAAADYIQHYGLVRPLDPATGKPRPVRICDSWVNQHAASTSVAFISAGHAAHHVDAAVPYAYTGGGHFKYPHGIVFSLFACFFPPLFMRITNPALERGKESLSEWESRQLDA